jgi:hypothetical protein
MLPVSWLVGTRCTSSAGGAAENTPRGSAGAGRVTAAAGAVLHTACVASQCAQPAGGPPHLDRAIAAAGGQPSPIVVDLAVVHHVEVPGFELADRCHGVCDDLRGPPGALAHGSCASQGYEAKGAAHKVFDQGRGHAAAGHHRAPAPHRSGPAAQRLAAPGERRARQLVQHATSRGCASRANALMLQLKAHGLGLVPAIDQCALCPSLSMKLPRASSAPRAAAPCSRKGAGCSGRPQGSPSSTWPRPGGTAGQHQHTKGPSKLIAKGSAHTPLSSPMQATPLHATWRCRALRWALGSSQQPARMLGLEGKAVHVLTGAATPAATGPAWQRASARSKVVHASKDPCTLSQAHRQVPSGRGCLPARAAAHRRKGSRAARLPVSCLSLQLSNNTKITYPQLARQGVCSKTRCSS